MSVCELRTTSEAPTLNDLHRLIQFAQSPRARPLRFLFVGGIATLTHLGIAAALWTLLPRTSPYAINAAAFLVAFGVSFYGHRHLTFGLPGSPFKFFVIALAGFALNNAILTAGLYLAVPPLAAIMVATICVPILTYFASALWAFRHST